MGRSLLKGLLLVLFALPVNLPAQSTAQPGTLDRAMDLEMKSQFREAAKEYRVALRTEANYSMALLGLERSLHEIGELDTLLVLIDSITRARPSEPSARTVQMRALQTLGRHAQLRTAFESWRTAAPREPAPFREYARTLIDGGRMQAADSVLREAEGSVANTRVLALEFAQVRSALGFWTEATTSWRRAVEDADYLERAATIGLSRAPADKREELRTQLLAPPLNFAVRKVLASLELNWGAPQEAWRALRDLPRGDSAKAAWLEFAEKAEAAQAWFPARDALLAALEPGGNPELASRAARAALSGGDAEGALALIAKESREMLQRDAARWFAIVHVRALAALGRASDAEAVAGQYARLSEDNMRPQIQHEVAWGWVRAGDITRARRTLGEGLNESDAGEIGGWISLYSGDLRSARNQLRGYGDAARFPGTVLAMSLLGRVRRDSSPQLGEAFLSLARADSVRSARLFQDAAAQLPEAASLLLVTAARLSLQRDTSASIALWQTVVEKHADSPEAAESDLEWARVLRKRGDRPGAIVRLEHLILSYPSSALVPQARRELESITKGSGIFVMKTGAQSETS